jgi:regulator of sigma E protease
METSPLLSLLALIVTLGVLITVHEFGHFWVARRLGVRVLKFSIGFGKPLWRRVGGDGVEYIIAMLPLGGYVKMLDEREEAVPAAELHRAFNRQPLKTRFAIVFAGPLFNFLFALAAYTLMFMVGVPGTRPLLDAPRATSPAALAGFEKGDEVIAIDGQETPTLSAALLALVDRAMSGEVIQVEVRDADERPRVRSLDLRDAPPGDEMRVFERAGLVPWQPVLPAVIGQVMPDGAAARAGLHAGLLGEVLQGQAVHHGAQHAHVVCPGALHAALREFGTAEEVAATDYDGDFNLFRRLGYFAGYLGDHVGVHPQAASPKCLARKLE